MGKRKKPMNAERRIKSAAKPKTTYEIVKSIRSDMPIPPAKVFKDKKKEAAKNKCRKPTDY